MDKIITNNKVLMNGATILNWNSLKKSFNAINILDFDSIEIIKK